MKLLLIAMILGVASTASAQSLTEAVAQLDGDTQDEVRAGIEGIGLAGNPAGVRPLEARIRKGLPGPLLATAIETLGVLGHASAGPILFEMTNHRRSTIRAAAITAIIQCRPRGADRALVEALADSDPQVRGLAATGLGELGARDAIDSLFEAFEHRVPEAATAIGLLATPEHVDRILGYLGNQPLSSLTPMFDELFARADMPERSKLAIVARLAELASPDVRAYLERLATELPSGRANDAVKRAAQEAAQRIAG